MPLFSAGVPLEFVIIELLRPQVLFTKANQYVDVITDWYTKVSRAIRSGNATTPHVAKAVFELLIIEYGISSHIHTDNVVQLT